MRWCTRVKYDRDTCIGMFQCADERGDFEKNVDDGKANLVDSKKTDDGAFVRGVPEDAKFDAKFIVRVCPVEAIRILDNDDE